ncbi:MAG: TIGR03435 family protein [Terriglobales bacterium]
MWQSRQRIRFLLVAGWLGTMAAAQAPAISAKLPSFDVVSVRPYTTGRGGGSQIMPVNGRWMARGTSLATLVARAFGLPMAQIEGLPKWTASYRLGITAETSARLNPTVFEQMLQSLLASRFAFRGHWEMRTMAARALRAAPGGVKVSPATDHCSPYGASPPRGDLTCGVVRPLRTFPDESQWKDSPVVTMNLELRGFSVSMDDVTQSFGANGDPMVDQTGYKGTFDFDVKYTVLLQKTARGESAPDGDRKLAAALRDQAGLIIEATKAPVRILVVDHVAQPTAN